jgi:hypothetical protein
MIMHLTIVHWYDIFLVNDIETCVGQFYDVLDECFDLTWCPWVDRELRNLDYNKTKAHKFMKRVSLTYESTDDEEDKTEFDAAFKSLHRMK